MTARLQLALDVPLAVAKAVVQESETSVDTIEVGTLLLMHDGLSAVEWARGYSATHRIVVDARITEAGGAIAEILFGAGADMVTVNAGTTASTLDAVCQCAARYGGRVQIELGRRFTLEDLQRWQEAGIRELIIHRGRDLSQVGWGPADVANIAWLDAHGFTVSVTGGLRVRDVEFLSSSKAANYIIGRAIVDAPDPHATAVAFRQAMGAGSFRAGILEPESQPTPLAGAVGQGVAP